MVPDTDSTRQPLAGTEGPEFWRGLLEDSTRTEEFRAMLAREFPDDADQWTDPVTRRHFLTLMGASLALAGVAGGCSYRPASPQKIYPYVQQPNGMTLGVPLFFATAMPLGGVATGVLVKSYEGRPVKIEGNPSHPGSLGASDIIAQASILGLYDPDRSQSISYKGTSRTWDEAIAALRTAIETQRGKQGSGLRILTETIASPSLKAQFDDVLKQLPQAKWVQFDAASRDNVREGGRLAFGKYVNTCYDFTKADVVLALDSDFLGCGDGVGNVRYQHDFATRRRVRANKEDGIPAEEMARLYAVECMLTNTGAKADHRLPLRTSEIEAFARALAAELKVEGVTAGGVPGTLAGQWLKPLAADLRRAGKNALVIVGNGQPPAVHAIAHGINAALGAVGQTVFHTQPVESQPSNQLADFRTLVADMAAGSVETLLILGGSNPAFTAPVDLEFGKALEKVATRFHFGLYADETAVQCDWHIPEAHYLESWGDARAYDGTVSILQPLIAPLYSGRTVAELVSAAFAEGSGQVGRDLVRDFWRKQWDGDQKVRNAWKEKASTFSPRATEDFDTFWQASLREGIVFGTAFPRENVALSGGWAGKLPASPPKGGTEIVFRPDPTLFDGRFANIGWLQELPKPISKITWDNVALMSPATAKKLDVTAWPRWTAGERGRVETNFVELTYQGRKLRLPAWPMPGHPDDAVTVYLGHGREQGGRVAKGAGFNAYQLQTADARGFDGGLEIAKTSDTFYVACTQMMYDMQGRRPVRQAPVEVFKDRAASPQRQREFDEIMAPSAAGGEKHEVAALVPGPNEKPVPPRLQHDLSHDDDHDHGHPPEAHDPRLRPLTLYPSVEVNKTYRRWGMVIDLTTCTGCSACMIACQSENNIPVVGKTEVTRAREMLWIRVDRYFEGDPNNAADLKTYYQPVPCQQCEKAPCELVCPVQATAHSADGLNDMVYNRCVGTRYCSNNCPYKVRRFNFLTYADYTTESLKLGRNPEVTVRSRGVMEKCTYCVQRIRAAEIEAERAWRTRPKGHADRPLIADGEIVTACQQACPSGAIVFGDIADEQSVVRRWKTEPTNYGLLAELNTMPRTSYLAALRNPNPEMPKGA